MALNNAGFSKMQAGDYTGALPLLERAVQKLQGANSLDEAYADYNLAFTRFQLGNCDGVLELLDRSESIQGTARTSTASASRRKTVLTESRGVLLVVVLAETAGALDRLPPLAVVAVPVDRRAHTLIPVTPRLPAE